MPSDSLYYKDLAHKIPLGHLFRAFLACALDHKSLANAMTEKTLKTLLEEGQLLSQLSTLAAHRQSESSLLLAALPSDIRANVTHAGLSGENKVTLTTNVAAWASRIRYMEPEIVERLKAAGFAVSSVRVRVVPPPDSSADR